MANNAAYRKINLDIQGHSYPIVIGQGLLKDGQFIRDLITSPQVMIVTNATVAPLYLNILKQALDDRACYVVILPDGEAFKNQEQLNTIYNELVKNKLHRDATLVALGGGVIGDISGFAASTYQRGMHFVQVPTTLLAHIDASIGGKTGINLPQGKNLIGSFYQPNAVLIDIHTLNTLPQREFCAGLAEMIKYALIEGGDFYQQLCHALAHGLDLNSKVLLDLITQCCQIKATCVASDEREMGNRALLNLGHTFAHALETYTHYERWLHGEAVAIGLYCAAILSHELGIAKRQLIDDVKKLLQFAGLPFQIPGTIDLEKLSQLMTLDKKVKNNKLRFVVIRAPGECYLEDKVTEQCIKKALTLAAEGE